jgi:hypothetical protein
MSDHDDKEDTHLKDNVDPRNEPENPKNEDRLPPGLIALPTPPSLGQTSQPSKDRFASMKADHEREINKIQSQRDSRPATGRSDAEREAQKPKLPTEKSAFLGDDFKDAKERESSDHFTPALGSKGPDKSDDRQR